MAIILLNNLAILNVENHYRLHNQSLKIFQIVLWSLALIYLVKSYWWNIKCRIYWMESPCKVEARCRSIRVFLSYIGYQVCKWNVHVNWGYSRYCYWCFRSTMSGTRSAYGNFNILQLRRLKVLRAIILTAMWKGTFIDNWSENKERVSTLLHKYFLSLFCPSLAPLYLKAALTPVAQPTLYVLFLMKDD